MEHRLRIARLLALLVPLALLAGAWGFQLIGHLYPCEMCHWQRWPHYAAVVLAALAFVIPGRGFGARHVLVWLAAVAIALSGLIGIYHAGVEYDWWQGHTACTSTMTGHGGTAAEMLDRIMKAPIVRCDQPQWTFVGVSLAGFNAVLSLLCAGVIFALLLRKAR